GRESGTEVALGSVSPPSRHRPPADAEPSTWRLSPGGRSETRRPPLGSSRPEVSQRQAGVALPIRKQFRCFACKWEYHNRSAVNSFVYLPCSRAAAARSKCP